MCLPFVLHGSDEFYEDVRHDEVQREFEDVYQGVKPEKQRDFDKIYESLKSSGDVSINDDYTNRDKTGVIISEDAEKVGSLSKREKVRISMTLVREKIFITLVIFMPAEFQ